VEKETPAMISDTAFCLFRSLASWGKGSKLPRLLAIPTNLIELSNCCVCLQMTFRFSLVDKDGTLYTINSVYYNDENDFPTLIFFRLIEWIVLKNN
jgi:hypothetical protein